MLIKHIEKTSLIDYPGYIASIIFVSGCNFSCPYCYNQALIPFCSKEECLSEEDVFNILIKRKKYIEGVVVTGGEPTAQKGLIEFLEKLRATGLRIKLDTNGYSPEVLEKILGLNLVDYIAMDIKASLDKYSEVVGINVNQEKITRSISLLKGTSIDNEFRTTVWKNYFTTHSEDEILCLVNGAKKFFIHNYFSTDSEAVPFQPALKSEISEFVKKADNVVGSVGLRGNWL